MNLTDLGSSSLLLPLQRAIAQLLANHPLLAGTEVMEERPGTVLTEIIRQSEGLKRCVIVYPPIVKKYNGNAGGSGVLFIEDLEIRIEASEHPKLNEGELNVYALNERIPLVLLLDQPLVEGVRLNPLEPDANPIQPVRHPERRIFHHVFHTSCGLSIQ